MYGFNPELMSDQELIDKLLQLQTRLGIAGRYGSAAVEQLNSMILLCSATLSERFDRRMFEARFGTAEGGEKVLTVAEDGEGGEKDIGIKTPIKVDSGLRMKRTSRPIKNDQ